MSLWNNSNMMTSRQEPVITSLPANTADKIRSSGPDMCQNQSAKECFVLLGKTRLYCRNMSTHLHIKGLVCFSLHLYHNFLFWLPSTVISLFKQRAKELWTDLDDLTFWWFSRSPFGSRNCWNDFFFFPHIVRSDKFQHSYLWFHK